MNKYRLHLPLQANSIQANSIQAESVIAALVLAGYIVQPGRAYISAVNNACVLLNVNIEKDIAIEGAISQIQNLLQEKNVRYYSIHLIAVGVPNPVIMVGLGNVWEESRIPTPTINTKTSTSNKAN